MIKSITVTSKTNNGQQILKDSLTATEKKVLIIMLNSGLFEGKVRNKVFQISKTTPGAADVTIYTTTKSELSGKNESTRQKVTIKYS